MEGDCWEAVADEATFSLRIASVSGESGEESPALRVCVEATSGRACLSAENGGPTLLVSAAEITGAGLAIAIERDLAVIDERKGPLPSTPLMPAALCHGIVYRDFTQGKIAELKLYLDPP